MQFIREKSSGYLTNWAARLFAREIDRALAGSGVSSGYMPVFFALGDGAAMTQKELAQRADVEQPTMAATLARMERDGLIQREADPRDRRSALVSLTPLARDKARLVKQAGLSVNELAMSHFTAGEREDYLRLLRKVISALDAPPDT